MNANFNCYQVLGLAPTERDSQTIIDAANAMIGKLNNSPNQSKRLEYQALVNQISIFKNELKTNPQILNDHAKSFAIIREKEKEEQKQGILTQGKISMNKEIDQAGLDLLIKRFNLFTENEILRVLNATKKKEETSNYKDDGIQELTQSTFNEINKNLKILNKKDLYDFLDLNPSSTSKTITDKHQELYDAYNLETNKTPEVTATGILCSHIISVLCDAKKRESYHKSIENLVFTDIYSQIDFATTSKKSITPDEYKSLIADCAKKNISEDKAAHHIDMYCKTKGVDVLKPSDRGSKRITCRFCEESNSPQSSACKTCGLPFVFNCPKCNRQSPDPDPKKADPKEMMCPGCGFSFGDMPNAINAIKQAENAYYTDDLPTAQKYLSKAESYWNIYPKIPDFKKKLNARLAEINASTTKMNELKREKKYVALKEYIQNNARKIDNSVATPYAAEADIAISKANAEITKARAATNHTVKINMYVQALNFCADTKEAIYELAPTNFNAEVIGKTVRLTWDKIPSNYIHYSIVRKANGRPVGISDGKIIASDITNCTFDDTTAETGVSYYYAVYCICAGEYSKTCAVNVEPAVVVQEIDNLVAVPVENEIKFTFALPKNAKGVDVYRDGSLINTITSENFTDRGLTPDKKYVYKFVAVFEDCLRKKHRSAGVSKPVTPTSLPKPVVLKENTNKDAMIVTWLPPTKGVVELYLFDKKQGWFVGQSIDVSELKGAFANIKITGNMARIPLDFHGIKYLYPATIHNNVYIIGAPLAVRSTQQVDGAFKKTGRQIEITWKWNKNVQAVEVFTQSDNDNGVWSIIETGKEAKHIFSVTDETKIAVVKIRNYLKMSDGTEVVSEDISKIFVVHPIKISFDEVSGGGWFSKNKYTLKFTVPDDPVQCDFHLYISEKIMPEPLQTTPYQTIPNSVFQRGKTITVEVEYARKDRDETLYFRLKPVVEEHEEPVAIIIPEFRTI